MFKFIKKLILTFSYGEELELLLYNKSVELRKAKHDLVKDNLNLCLKHKQESNHSHYAEHNCEYCKLLAERNSLKLMLDKFTHVDI